MHSSKELKEGEHRADMKLGEKLETEESRTSFLGLVLVKFWRIHAEEGLGKLPEDIQEETDGYRKERDIYKQFVEREAVLGRGMEYRVSSRDLQERFNRFSMWGHC